MFVWAMRDKGSEWKAMQAFLAAGQLPFTPLVEAVCEPVIYQGKNPVTVVSDFGRKVAPLTESGRVWVDLHNLLLTFSANDVAELYEVFRASVGPLSHLITPVVRTSSPAEVRDAAFAWAQEYGPGICIRVEGVGYVEDKAKDVAGIVVASGFKPSSIDLIFDAQDLPRVVSHRVLRDLFPISQEARNWVVLGGSFPTSITDMKPDDYEHKWERREWTAWRDEMEGMATSRRPLYGDYATQPPIYVPSPPFPGSPSVRYTAGEEYVVLRGRRAAGAGQYIGHALYLREQEYYKEVVETPGDLYIDGIALRTKGTGNATTWRIASLERHLHVVGAQVARFASVLARAQ